MTTAGAPPPALRALLWHTVQAGLTPLVPVPFVDDWFLGQVRKRMVRERLRTHGLEVDKAKLKQLLSYGDRGGFLLGCLGLLMYPLKVVFRKIFFFLAVRRCANIASDVFHEGYLVEHALATGALGRALDDPPELERVCQALWRTRSAVDPGPVTQALLRTFRGSKELLLSAATWVARKARRKPDSADAGEPPTEGAEAGVAPDYLDRLVETIWYRREYLEELGRRLDDELAKPPASAGQR